MRFAIPITGETLDQHFGHCEKLAFLDVAEDTHEIISMEIITTPTHDHSELPFLIRERGATHVLAGGMGVGMQMALESVGVKLLTGAPAERPADLVRRYLSGELQLEE